MSSLHGDLVALSGSVDPAQDLSGSAAAGSARPDSSPPAAAAAAPPAPAPAPALAAADGQPGRFQSQNRLSRAGQGRARHANQLDSRSRAATYSSSQVIHRLEPLKGELPGPTPPGAPDGRGHSSNGGRCGGQERPPLHRGRRGTNKATNNPKSVSGL